MESMDIDTFNEQSENKEDTIEIFQEEQIMILMTKLMKRINIIKKEKNYIRYNLKLK